MTLLSGILVSPAKKIDPIAVAAAITIISLAPNFTITNAQQLQTGQQSSISIPHSPTLLNSKDSFRVNLPAGWVIQDINNTGFTLAAEVLQGYGLLAQLCPQQERQQPQPSSTRVSSSSSTYIGSCQHAGEEVIHIIRYPNLGARIGILSDEDNDNNILITITHDTVPDIILEYHLQKLREVGYQDIQITNSTDTTINIDISTDRDNKRITTIPAKFVEMIYSTNLAPNETKRGYFLLTATAATPRNLGVLTGYSIFYEGNSTVAGMMPFDSLGPTPLPTPVRQVFDSFELIAALPAESLMVSIISDDTEGGIAPATIEFEANVTGGIEPYTYGWDFGDGSVEMAVDDETTEHTFDTAGTYDVDLTVTDSTGRNVSDSIPIAVREVTEEEEQEEDGADNNLDLDDLIDVDEIINDLFDRLGLGN